jgi:hypothetical protein
MKSIVRKIALVFGALLLAGNAIAANSNAMTISGASFEDYYNTGTRCAEKWNGGLANSCDITHFVYGIPKGPSTAGYTITTAGSHTTTATTDCTVFSYSSTGTFLAYSTNSASNVSGSWTRSITFNATQAPASGRLTSIVSLAGYYVGSLYGLTIAY